MLSSAAELPRRPSSPYEPPAWIQDFAKNRRPIEFVGKDGADRLEEWRGQTEERIRVLMEFKPLGLLHALAILRRLPNDQFFLGEREDENDPRRFDPYQANVAERAVLRYATWDARGVEIEDWQPELPGLVQDKPVVSVEDVAEIWALVQHAGVGLAHVDNMRKAVVRGGRVLLRPDGNADSRQEPELQRRLNLYDERRRRFSFFGATAGTFHPSDFQTKPGQKAVACVARTSFREDEGRQSWRYENLRRSIPKWDKRFGFAQVDLQPAYDYMKLLEHEVNSQYKLVPEQIVAALMSVSRLLANFLAPGGTLEALLPDRLAHLDRRGYLLVREQVMDDVVLGRWAAEAFGQAFPGLTHPEDPAAYAHGFKRLAYLDSYRKEDLSILDGCPWITHPGRGEPVPMPPPFIYPAGSHRIVDLNAVGDFVNGLFECLVLEEQPRQRVAGTLERRLADYMQEGLDHLRAFETSKKLYAKLPGQNRKIVAELDASIRIGSVLVAVDAKSIRVSTGYRKYEHGALRTRWQKFEDYVDHADEQAGKLASQSRGTNFDLPADGYTHVVTLLCSTMPEFIDTDDANFYVKEDLPRVATPLELRDFLAEVTEDDLKALPFAKRITGA